MTHFSNDYDVDGIVRELINAYDLTGPAAQMTVDNVPLAEFWSIVERFDVSGRTS